MILLDVESRSRADLRRVGGRLYWQHPSSQILVVVWYDTDTGDVGTWAPGQPWPHPESATLAAHNAHGFDRHAFARYGIHVGGEWVDTSQLARKAGMPGALDAIGTRWAGVPKDKAASEFTTSLSSVRRPTGTKRVVVAPTCPDCGATGPCLRKDGQPRVRPHPARTHTVLDGAISREAWASLSTTDKREMGVLPEITPDDMARVTDYCASDVAIMVHTWPRLRAWRHIDADVEALDRTINDRGVAFDSALARRLLAEDARVADATCAEVARELGMHPTDARAAAQSPVQFCAITGAPNAQKATVETMTHPLARLRRALASIARGKLTAGLTRVHADGRLRDELRYYGAHTGRWSGRGMQLQNMPRPAKRVENYDVDAFARKVLAGAPCDADEVALLVRATVHAPPGRRLACCDFASVEARATAWAAEDHAALDVFRSDRDPYRVAGAIVFGCDYEDAVGVRRQIGKVCELALGYGGGVRAFDTFARVYRIDVDALGLDRQAVVDAWRKLHAPIVSLWHACERAFRSACKGRTGYAGPFEYRPGDGLDAGCVACVLPSGRPIIYNDARAAGRDLTYHGTRGEEHVYGGKLVENAVQAMCRDLMAGAMLAAEQAGLRPVLTVHDEIVCEVLEERASDAYDSLRTLMREVPAWARGLPVDAKGWHGERYRK